MRNTLFWILFLFILPLQAQQKLPYLQKQGSTTQLMVDGEPFLVIGGELGNSSASSIEYIPEIATYGAEYSTGSYILGFNRTTGR